MILVELFLAFLKIGCFAFGGAYAAIPLIRDEVMAHAWMSEEMFSNIIAVAETTPGPIMVNTATYVGFEQGGIVGSILATLGVILPAFVIILIVTKVFTKMLENSGVQSVLKGIKPTIMGIILGTGIAMTFSVLCGKVTEISVDWRAVILAVLLGGLMMFWGKIKQVVKVKFFPKSFNPIFYIGIAALLGIIVYSF